ncbi:hemolysin family protein [Chloroflexota bacterium]
MAEGSISTIIALLVLLIINALFSLGYHALVNVQKVTLLALIEEGSKRARLAYRVSEDATRLLNTYQLGVLLLRFFSAGIAAVGLGLPLAAQLTTWGLTAPASLVLAGVIVLLLGAVITLMVGGQIPGVIGAAYAERLALWAARPMVLAEWILAPMAGVLRRMSDAVVHLLRIEADVHNVTEEEILTLVDAGQEEGVIETEEKEMIFSVLQLGDTSVREVMVPRLDLVALPIDTPLDIVVETVLAAGHSRIPVYEDNIDHISGLLYAKDLLHLWGKGSTNGDGLASLLRPTYFVPEGKGARDLLQEMQNKRVHLAIIVDEYGGTAGLVTLEDLIEEIIGEVRDEYDLNEVAAYQRISDDEYICNARLDLDDLNRLLDIDLPTDESDTLGGFIFAQIGEVPEAGTVIGTGQVRLVVLTVDQRRIGQVRVTKVTPTATDEETTIVDEGNTSS